MQDTNPTPQDDEQWRSKLTPEQYHVMREKGTEAPFSGKYNHETGQGMYVCSACGHELFSSQDKYDSGSGWPSFTTPVREGAVETAPDSSLGMKRIEAVCPNCGAHLGHVFDDGPTKLDDGAQASGKRYCINSVALDLREDETN